MKTLYTALGALALVAFSASPAAALFIPIGPPVYTPQPDIVTPQPDTVTIIPGAYVDTGPSSPEPYRGGCTSPSEKFTERFGDGWCNPGTLSPLGGGYKLPDTERRTTNPDLITPQPDLCSQPGLSIPGGFGSRPC